MSTKFPFQLDEIQSWIVRRKDGLIVRFNYVSPEAVKAKPKVTPYKSWSGGNYSSAYSYKDWCSHEPHPATQAPVCEADGIALWIADAVGARKVFTEFDVCIDGGSVLTVPGEHDLPNIYGDPGLRNALAKYVITPKSSEIPAWPKIIKLRWNDRAAPPVYVSFWPALLDQLKKIQPQSSPLKVLTICQGGHGRSGTALTALMMCLTNYTPLEALTHIRALHCARAIESKDQHVYLNALGKFLGRNEDALEAEGVSSFKDRFLASTNPIAEPYKDRLKSGKGAKVTEREGSYL